MASERIERFRAGFEAFSRGDMDAVNANFAPEFEVHDHVILDSTEGPRGSEALAYNLSQFREAFEKFNVEPLEFEEFDGGVLVRLRVIAHVERDGGMDLELEVGQLWRVGEDDLATSLDIYPSWEEARRAAGLHEGS